MMLLYYSFTKNIGLHMLINCQWVSHVQHVSVFLMPDKSMRSFIEEDIHVHVTPLSKLPVISVWMDKLRFYAHFNCISVI